MNDLTPARVLTIAGSDCSGGAGIQADLKTIEAIGGYGMSVITVLTAQNTRRVKSLFPISPTFVVDQISAIFEDIDVQAVKIGMIYSTTIIEAVAACLKKFRAQKVVLDPVMIAKSGDPLLQGEAIAALKELLLPFVDLVTPNIPEAEILTGISITDGDSMQRAAAALLQLTKGVVLKGGHLRNPVMSPDLFALADGDRSWLEYSRIDTRNTHGTGCSYSAAIAGFAAKGWDWKPSVMKAREFLQGAIVSAVYRKIGKGQGPIHHHWRL